MTAERPPIRWIYPIVAGIIAESMTIALTALAVALTGHASAAGDPVDPVAQRIGAIAGATVGSMLCFVAGWWAARRADARFEAHGLLTGAAAGTLSALGAVYGPHGQTVYYVVAVLMKLFAGRAGGGVAARMAAGG